MIIVTNRIQVKPGFAARMAPNFTKPGPLQQFEGFHKVEVLISTDDPTYDEMSVNMYWESKEHFQAWRNSDAFAAAINAQILVLREKRLTVQLSAAKWWWLN